MEYYLVVPLDVELPYILVVGKTLKDGEAGMVDPGLPPLSCL